MSSHRPSKKMFPKRGWAFKEFGFAVSHTEIMRSIHASLGRLDYETQIILLLNCIEQIVIHNRMDKELTIQMAKVVIQTNEYEAWYRDYVIGQFFGLRPKEKISGRLITLWDHLLGE